MKKNKMDFMEINLSIKYSGKYTFIKREIPNIQIVQSRFPANVVAHNLNEMIQRIQEKLVTVLF